MMHNETLEAIKRSAVIPSMPLVATRCYEMANDPKCEYHALVELLSTDPGIAADVLRLSNSPLFGVTRQVSSLRHAITLLGMKRIRDLVLSRYLVQKLDQAASDLIDINYYWRRSLTTAILAAKFADTLLPQRRDEAFVGGLLADVGVVILAKALPRQYKPIVEQYRPHGSEEWIQGEYNLMGVTHGEVTALVLEQWNLPLELVEAVRHHHTSPVDMPKEMPGRTLAQIIGGTDMIAKVLGETTEPERAAAACTIGMERVQLDVSVLVRALDGIESDIETMASLLSVEVVNSKIFAQLSQQLIESLGSPAVL